MSVAATSSNTGSIMYNGSHRLPTTKSLDTIVVRDGQSDVSSVVKSVEMSGEVILEGPIVSERRYVHVKVYRTSLEHFAVVYPLSKISRPLGVINLRTASTIESLTDEAEVEKNRSKANRLGFLIRQKMFDTTTSLKIWLCDSSLDHFERWRKAFDSDSSNNNNNNNNNSHHHQQASSCLPIVEEEESDHNEDD